MAVDDGAIADQHGALDNVLEFAHVARPVIGGQHVDGWRRDPANVRPCSFAYFCRK